MIQVALLTIHQKDSLVGQLVEPDVYFNPIQDINDDWVISLEEINNSIYPEHEWIKDLPLINFIPKPGPPII